MASAVDRLLEERRTQPSSPTTATTTATTTAKSTASTPVKTKKTQGKTSKIPVAEEKPTAVNTVAGGSAVERLLAARRGTVTTPTQTRYESVNSKWNFGTQKQYNIQQNEIKSQIGEYNYNALQQALGRRDSLTQSGKSFEDWYRDEARRRDEAEAGVKALEDELYELRKQQSDEALSRGLSTLNTGRAQTGSYGSSYAEELKALEAELEIARRDSVAAGYITELADSIRFDDIADSEAYKAQALRGRRSFAAKQAARQPAADTGYDPFSLADASSATPAAAALAGYMSDKLKSYKNYQSDTTYREPTEDWTDAERDRFYYLYSRDINEAYEYGQKINDRNKAQSFVEKQEELEDWTTKNLGTKALGTATAVVTTPLAWDDLIDTALEYKARGTVTQRENISAFDAGNIMSAAIAQSMNEKDSKFNRLIQKVGGSGTGDLYQIGLSTLQNMVYGHTLGAAATGASYFAAGTMSAFEDAYARGVPVEKAMTYGLMAGAAESVAEGLNIAALLNIKSSSAIKGMISNALKQGLAEGSEEVATQLMDTLADVIINGDKSRLDYDAQMYMLQGMDPEDAEKQAMADWMKETAFSFISGAASGALSGGIETGIQNRRQYQGDVQALIDEAMLTPEGSTARATAQEYAERIADSGEKGITNREALRLQEQTERSVKEVSSKRQKEAIRQEARNKLIEAGYSEAEAGELADIISRRKTGEKISRAELQRYTGNEKVLNIGRSIDARALLETARESAQSERDTLKIENLVAKKVPKQVINEKNPTVKTDDGEAKLTGLSYEDGEVKLNLKWADGSMAMVSQADAELPEDVQSFVDQVSAYKESAPVMFGSITPGQDMSEYLPAWTAAEQLLGRNTTLSLEAARAKMDSMGMGGVLSEGQFKLAFEEGRRRKEEDARRTKEQAKKETDPSSTAEAVPLPPKGKAKGGVSYEGGVVNGVKYHAVDHDGLNQRQRNQIAAIELLAEKTGINFVFYESQADSEGKLHGANGIYSNGTIYLDVNAGINSKRSMKQIAIVRAAAHELTHYIQQYAKAQYEELKSFMLTHLVEMEGRDFNDLVNEKMARDTTGKLSYEGALDEIVADGCEMMLRRTKVMQAMAEEKPSLFETIKEWLSEWLETLKAAFEGVEPRHKEARSMIAHMEQLQEMWDKGLAKAVTEPVDSKNTATEGGVQMSLRQFEDGRKFVDVNIDQAQFDGLSEKEMQTKAVQIIKNKFAGKVIGITNRAFVNGRTATEYGRPVKNIEDKTAKEAKMRASTELDNLIEAGTNFRTAPDGADGHIHPDAVGDFKYFDTLFKVGDNYFYGVINILPIAKGDRLIDITKIENVTEDIVSSYGENPKSNFLSDTSMVSIRSNDAKSNTQNEEFEGQFSERDIIKSDRELLAEALESVAQNEQERRLLERYKNKAAEYDMLEVQLELAETALRQARERSCFSQETAEAKEAVDKLAAELKKADEKLLELQATEHLKQILQREERRARSEARKKTKRQIAEKNRMDTLRRKIERNVVRLSKMLNTNSKAKHVPEILKPALAEFLTSIDMSNKSAIYGGKETKKAIEIKEGLERVRNALDIIQRGQRNELTNEEFEQYAADIGSYIDLPEGFIQQIGNLLHDIDYLEKYKGVKFTPAINNMDVLNQLDQILGTLSKTVSTMNELFTTERFKHADKAAEASMEELGMLGSLKRKIKAAADFINYENTNPIFAFDTFGAGGKDVFQSIIRGWERFAGNMVIVQKFMDKEIDPKQVKNWRKEKHTVKLQSGKSIELSGTQVMSFYALWKREQAQGHIMRGGIKLAEAAGSKGEDTSKGAQYLMQLEDVQAIISLLSEEQRKLADKVQHFMTQTGSDWGNYVTMNRWGYKGYTEDIYFPIRTDSRERPAQTDAKLEGKGDMTRLLNIAPTKALTPKASNALIIDDFFNVFTDHMADMAKYNALALPILDAMKWYNYKKTEFVDIEEKDGQIYRKPVTSTMQNAISMARGKAANSYFTNFMTDLNGTREGGRGEGWAKALMANYKLSSVGTNLRVLFQQGTSYIRAALMIDPKYMLTSSTKKAREEMIEYSGIAVWKTELGFYDVNVNMGLRERLEGKGNFMSRLQEWSTKGAGYADSVTMGAIWNSCKKETQARTGLSGKELLEATARRFNEVVLRTQVIDSTISRSQLMRSNSSMTAEFAAFMSEPTIQLNIVQSMLREMEDELRRTGNKAEVWNRHKRKFARTMSVLPLSIMGTAMAAAIADAMRDDDEYQSFAESWLENTKKNFADSINPLTWIPVVSDIYSLIRGESHSSTVTGGIERLVRSYQVSKELYDLHTGEIDKPTELTYYGNMTEWGAIYQVLNGMGAVTGLSLGPGARDIVAVVNTIYRVWNFWVGDNNGQKLEFIKTYDAGIKGNIQSAYVDGYLTEEEAKQLLIESGEEKNEKDAEQTIYRWGLGGKGVYDAVKAAVLASDKAAYESAVQELEDKQYKLKEIESEVRSAMKLWYQGDEDGVRVMPDKQKVIRYLQEFAGMDAEDAKALVEEWTCKVVTGIDYNEIKTAYIDGDISESRAQQLKEDYGGYTEDEAKETLKEWKFEKETGIAYSEMKEAYEDGELTATEYVEKRAEISGSKSYTEAMADYETYAAPAGMNKSDFYSRWIELESMTKDVDENGDVLVSVQEKRWEFIDSLNLSPAQKDALHLTFYSSKTLKDAPWNN